MAGEQELRTYLKKAVADLQDTRARLARVQRRAHEPIAVVGMACTLPGGVHDPDALWQLLDDERDAVTGFPTDRDWDLSGAPDGMPCFGGFLDDITGFDADFFGISPREAVAMDPQHRLLLESCWAALEDAHLDPRGLRGSTTGVYAGIIYNQYCQGAEIPPAVLPFVGTGTAGSVLSGRVSHLLGLEGPSLTLDTACSSSLVAVHLAVQALRSGQCERAIAGGVTAMVAPDPIIDFGLQGNLADSGRCRAYAAGADGTTLSEGVAVVVLERLSDALAAGRRVHAVIRGSAVNQDGASNGLTAPNGPAQQRVIAGALADAGLDAASVDLVEGHGTGTALGDPIEAQALLVGYGQDRPEPVRLGALKSNLGHTQAAAGVAGLIKVALSLQHRRMPRSLHLDAPSAQVDWTEGSLELLAEARDWPAPAGGHPRRAAVSSFGISGTNAHLVVEEAPAVRSTTDEPEDTPTELPLPLLLSARTPAAVAAQAAALAPVLDRQPAGDTHAVARTLLGRTAFEHRAAVRDPHSVAALAAGRPAAGTTVGSTGAGGHVAFVFTGQGAQRVGMGRDLHRRSPAFRAAFDAAADAFDPLLPRPLREIVFAEPGSADAALLDDTRFTQPALFAVEVALAALLRTFGVRPRHVAGHSIGEIAAAHVAGVLSLPDACTLVAARARLMSALPAGGGMLAVQTGAAEAARYAAAAGVDVAAVNAPDSAVLSGDLDRLEALAAELRSAGVRCTPLTVSHAFHSRRMQPMLDEFAAVARALTYSAPHTPIVSTVTGRRAGPEIADAAYWVAQVGATVRFADAVATLTAAGAGAIVEIGPDAVLTAMAGATVDAPATAASAGRPARRPVLVATQRRDRDGVDAAVDALAELYVTGHDVDWTPAAGAGPRADVATYPFQHRRFWLSPADGTRSRDEATFWQAVETADAAGIAATLDLDDAQRAALDALLPQLRRWRAGATGDAVAQLSPDPAPGSPDERESPAEELRTLAPDERDRTLVEIVAEQCAVVLGRDDGFDPDADLLDVGFTSLTAVELRNRLEFICAIELPVTLVYEFTCAREIALFCSEQLAAPVLEPV